MALLREDRKLSVDPRAPERSYLALFRLVPWLRPRRRSDAAVDARFYTDKPGQNPLEIRMVSTLFNLTWTLLLCGAASHLFAIGPLLAPFIFVAASLGTLLVIVVLMIVAELVVRMLRRAGRSPRGVMVQSVVHQGALLIACVEAAFDSHWVRWVGLAWLSLFAIEMAARMIETIRSESEQQPSES